VPDSGFYYSPRPEATPEAELTALANVYAFVLDSAKNRGRLPDKSGPDDVRKDQDAHTARARIPEQ
jgi:hypothetical protein